MILSSIVKHIRTSGFFIIYIYLSLYKLKNNSLKLCNLFHLWWRTTQRALYTWSGGYFKNLHTTGQKAVATQGSDMGKIIQILKVFLKYQNRLCSLLTIHRYFEF